MNNPLIYADPLGLKPCPVIGSDGTAREGECIDVEGEIPEDEPPPPPEIELQLSDEMLRWLDERWHAVDHLRNPITGMTVGDVASATADFWVGVGDGASFGIVAGLRDDEDKQHIDTESISYNAGIVTGAVSSSSAGSLRGAAYLTRFKAFRFVNNDRYVRVGPSKWPRTQGRIPVLRIGTQRQTTWNHWRLTVLGR